MMTQTSKMQEKGKCKVILILVSILLLLTLCFALVTFFNYKKVYKSFLNTHNKLEKSQKTVQLFKHEMLESDFVDFMNSIILSSEQIYIPFNIDVHGRHYKIVTSLNQFINKVTPPNINPYSKWNIHYWLAVLESTKNKECHIPISQEQYESIKMDIIEETEGTKQFLDELDKLDFDSIKSKYFTKKIGKLDSMDFETLKSLSEDKLLNPLIWYLFKKYNELVLQLDLEGTFALAGKFPNKISKEITKDYAEE